MSDESTGRPEIVVGAPGVNSSAGAAYVFTQDSGGWKERAFVKPRVVHENAYFGGSVALELALHPPPERLDRLTELGEDHVGRCLAAGGAARRGGFRLDDLGLEDLLRRLRRLRLGHVVAARRLGAHPAAVDEHLGIAADLAMHSTSSYSRNEPTWYLPPTTTPLASPSSAIGYSTPATRFSAPAVAVPDRSRKCVAFGVHVGTATRAAW